jgi:hypothetical protein
MLAPVPDVLLPDCGDAVKPDAPTAATASATGAPLVVLEGAGPLPTARHPVKVNLLIRDFVDQLTGRR